MGLDPVHINMISQLGIYKLSVRVGYEDGVSGADLKVGHGGDDFHN